MAADDGLKVGHMLFVGGLDAAVDEALLRAAFVPFGEVKEVTLPPDPESTGHRGFAFVLFEDDEDAEEAKFNMNGAELRGRVLHVNDARPGQSGGPAWQAADKWYADMGVKAAAGGSGSRQQEAAQGSLRQGLAPSAVAKTDEDGDSKHR